MPKQKTKIQQTAMAAEWKNPAGYTSDILARARKESTDNLRIFLLNFTTKQKNEGLPEKMLWRWEFLRRMPEYQMDYAEYISHEIPADPGKLLRRYGLLCARRILNSCAHQYCSLWILQEI